MRIAVAALCVLALTAPSQAAGLYCLNLKTVPWVYRMEPTVPYRAYTIPSDLLNSKYCSDPNAGEVVGCAYPMNNGANWIIVIADTVSAADYPCVLAYEKSHMPPNCWGDASFEKAGAMDFLDKTCGPTAD